MLHLYICFAIINPMSVVVTRKDAKEDNGNILRRFDRKVAQAGTLVRAKLVMRFSKPMTRTERRKRAILRVSRKQAKQARQRLGART